MRVFILLSVILWVGTLHSSVNALEKVCPKKCKHSKFQCCWRCDVPWGSCCKERSKEICSPGCTRFDYDEEPTENKKTKRGEFLGFCGCNLACEKAYSADEKSTEAHAQLDVLHERTRELIESTASMDAFTKKQEKYTLQLAHNLNGLSEKYRKSKLAHQTLNEKMESALKKQQATHAAHSVHVKNIDTRLGVTHKRVQAWQVSEQTAKNEIAIAHAELKTTQKKMKETLVRAELFSSQDAAQLKQDRKKAREEAFKHGNHMLKSLEKKQVKERQGWNESVSVISKTVATLQRKVGNIEKSLNDKIENLTKSESKKNLELKEIERNLYESMKQNAESRAAVHKNLIKQRKLEWLREDFRRYYEKRKNVVSKTASGACSRFKAAEIGTSVFTTVPLALASFPENANDRQRVKKHKCLQENFNSFVDNFCQFKLLFIDDAWNSLNHEVLNETKHCIQHCDGSSPRLPWENIMCAKGNVDITKYSPRRLREMVPNPLKVAEKDLRDFTDIKVDLQKGYQHLMNAFNIFFNKLSESQQFNGLKQNIQYFSTNLRSTEIDSCGPRVFVSDESPMALQCQMLVPWKELYITVGTFLTNIRKCAFESTCDITANFANLQAPISTPTQPTFLDISGHMVKRAVREPTRGLSALGVSMSNKRKQKNTVGVTKCGRGVPLSMIVPSDRKRYQKRFCGTRYVNIQSGTEKVPNYAFVNLGKVVSGAVWKSLQHSNASLVYDVKQGNCPSPLISTEGIELDTKNKAVRMKLNCDADDGYCGELKRCMNLDYIPASELTVDVYVDTNGCCKGVSDLNTCLQRQKCRVGAHEVIPGRHVREKYCSYWSYYYGRCRDYKYRYRWEPPKSIWKPNDLLKLGDLGKINPTELELTKEPTFMVNLQGAVFRIKISGIQLKQRRRRLLWGSYAGGS